MPTSDQTPTGNTPANEQRLDRLYQAQHTGARRKDPELTSPADLDELIRAAAKTSQRPAPSAYWNWQQRFGWATAAVVVLTSALFLALPETPSMRLEPSSKRQQTTAVAVPVQQEPLSIEKVIAETATTDNTAFEPLAQESASIGSSEPEPALGRAPAPRMTPTAPPALAPMPPPSAVDMAADMASEMAVEPRSAPAEPEAALVSHLARERRAKQAAKAQPVERQQSNSRIEEIVVTGSASNPNCEAVISEEQGLVTGICTVPGRNRSYILQPNESSKCNDLRLDRQRTRPTPAAESTAERFVYTVGSRTYSATCERGNWVVQPFARGR